MQLIVISVVGGALGSVVILAFTVGLSIVSFRRGWDLDAVGTPMVTALGDAATLPTLFLASLLVESDFVTAAAAIACVGAAAWSVVAAMRSDRPEVRRIVLQMIGVIALTPLLDIAAGGLLGRFQSELVRNAGILILIPPSSPSPARSEASSPPVCPRRSRSASFTRPCGRKPSRGRMRRSSRCSRS